jgi:hypothetical protein
MAQLYATGPVLLWVKFPMDDEPQFLGVGQRAPVVDVIPSFTPRYADVSGPTIPLDLLHSGDSGRVSVDLNFCNMNVLQAVRTRSRNVTFPRIDPGGWDPGQLGMPLIASGCVPVLYLRFASSEKPSYTNFVNGNVPDGYRFFAAILDPECVRPGGTSAEYKTHLLWNCLRKYDRAAKNQYGRGALRLYDEDVSEVSSLEPN